MFHMRNITGSQIRHFRLRHNLTQEQLAVQLQVRGFSHTRNTIAKIESGLRRITDIELQAVASALDVPVAYLFGDTDEDYKATCP